MTKTENLRERELSTNRSDSDELHYNSFASYDWGSGVILLSQFARMTREDIAQMIGVLSIGEAPWRTDFEFRRLVAFLHELVHYQQDVCTGLGHWDYIIRERAVPRLLGKAQLNNHVSGRKIVFGDVDGDLFQVRAEGRLTYANEFDSSFINALRLRNAISSEKNNSTSNTLGIIYTIEDILEAEAYLEVFNTLLSVKAQAWQMRIMYENDKIFIPSAVSSTHGRLINEISESCLRSMRKEDQECLDEAKYSRNTRLAKHYELYSFLIDLALAYPPPTYFDNGNHNSNLYNPPVKFFILQEALGALAADKVDKIKSMPAGEKGIAFEQEIYKNCSMSYPSLSEIHALWVNYFRDTPGINQKAGATQRAVLSNIRVGDNGAFRRKTILNFLDTEMLPLLVHCQGDRDTYLMVTNPGSEFNRLFLEWERDAEARFLARWFFLETPFSCPRVNFCGNATQYCHRGIVLPTQMPPSPLCGVRASLERSDFSFAGADKIMLDANRGDDARFAITDKLLDTLTRETQGQLLSFLIRADSKSPAVDNDSLHMGGIDPAVLGWIAEKVVLPVVTGFVSRTLYERWRSLRERTDAATLKKELESASLASAESVEKSQLIADVIISLEAEGISSVSAKAIAERLVDRTERVLFATRS